MIRMNFHNSIQRLESSSDKSIQTVVCVALPTVSQVFIVVLLKNVAYHIES